MIQFNISEQKQMQLEAAMQRRIREENANKLLRTITADLFERGFRLDPQNKRHVLIAQKYFYWGQTPASKQVMYLSGMPVLRFWQDSSGRLQSDTITWDKAKVMGEVLKLREIGDSIRNATKKG